MHDTSLTGIQEQMAVEVCQRFTLEDEARQLLQDNLSAQQFLELLIEHEQFLDATRFLAHALPKRDAIRWACLCLRSLAATEDRPENLAALQAAETWLAEPSEANRRAAMQAAEILEFHTPASWAAVAVFWSEGSLAPPDVPPVPPGEHLTAVAAAAAVTLAAVLTEPEKAADKYKTFLAQGLALTTVAGKAARGENDVLTDQ